MNKETFNMIKKELMHVGILFIVFFIIFKLIYYKDSFLTSLRVVASLFWMFVLPGYFVMLYWKEQLGFTERFAIGIAISAALVGIFSYYLGLMGLNIKYHYILLPVALVMIGIFFNFSKKN